MSLFNTASNLDKKFVKIVDEISTDDGKGESDEKTPKRKVERNDQVPALLKKRRIVTDESMHGIDTSRFITTENAKCRFVTERGVCFIAFSSSSRFVSSHRIQRNFKSSPCQLPKCKNRFTSAEDIIAPVVIVSPEYSERYGLKSWVCFDHWSRSVYHEEDEDDTVMSASLLHDVSILENKGMLQKSKVAKKLDMSLVPSDDDSEEEATNTEEKEKVDEKCVDEDKDGIEDGSDPGHETTDEEEVLAKRSRSEKKQARRTVVTDPMEGSSKKTVTRNYKLKSKKSLLEILNKSDSEDPENETNDDGEGVSDEECGNKAVAESPDMFDSKK